MMVAVFSNARTTVSAKKEGEEGWRAAFNVAFRAGVCKIYICTYIYIYIYTIYIYTWRAVFNVAFRAGVCISTVL